MLRLSGSGRAPELERPRGIHPAFVWAQREPPALMDPRTDTQTNTATFDREQASAAKNHPLLTRVESQHRFRAPSLSRRLVRVPWGAEWRVGQRSFRRISPVVCRTGLVDQGVHGVAEALT